MPAHDIIDNRTEKLTDHLNQMLTTSERARFAVGYLFLSGLTAVAERLLNLKELRLLIGNTSNRETVEMLAEGYRRLDLAAEEVERQVYPKRAEAGKMAQETAANLRNAVEWMDQTDEAQELIAGLIGMVEEKRLQVRVYTKGRLHAKAYICDYGEVFDSAGKRAERHEKGIAVVGSSNLTLAGLTHNTELNVIVQGNQNHGELVRWFDDLRKEAQDFDEILMQELKESWAAAQVRPYDIYMKTLYALVRDRLEGEEEQELLWDDEIFRKLASFQKVAVRQAVQMIRDFGGTFVSDVVGLGKSYIGAAIVKHFERTDHARPLVIRPAPLKEMWERYNEVYQLNARVLSMGYLREDDTDGVSRLLKDFHYKDRDFVLVDESHNFRHPDTQRYRVVQTFLSTGRRCCFLTATPRNKSAWDVYHQIKLFHQDDRTDLAVDPPNIINYDLHWNPVRLIQRFGRIDRIGSEHDVIFAYNFLPEVGIERNLGLHGKLRNRIQEIHDTIGEDAKILDESERLNPEAMYAIYETRGEGPVQLDLWEKPEEEFLDLNEAEEILRQLRKDDPAEFERIANLRDGIRTARPSIQKGMFVFCQAGRFQQLVLLDKEGAIVSRDVPKVVGVVRCAPDAKAADLPSGYNKAVMAVQRAFAEDVKHREAERTHSFNLTHGQLYVLRELRVLFEVTADEEIKANINVLEKAFRGVLTGAVKRELNQLRRNAVAGEILFKQLVRIYDQHNLKDVTARRSLDLSDKTVPRIICSEAFV